MGGDGKDIGDDSTTEVLVSTNDLTADVDEPTIALANLNKLLRLATLEGREYKCKYEATPKQLDSIGASMVVSNKTKCNECALHMSNITIMQTMYATLLHECDELRSSFSLLDAYQTCPSCRLS